MEEEELNINYQDEESGRKEENRKVRDFMKENPSRPRNFQGLVEPWMSAEAKEAYARLLDKAAKGTTGFREEMVRANVSQMLERAGGSQERWMIKHLLEGMAKQD